MKIPAPGTENDDWNPARVRPRNLFNMAIGTDNLFHTERVRWTLRLEAFNITNKLAVYNFLSTAPGHTSSSPGHTARRWASRSSFLH